MDLFCKKGFYILKFKNFVTRKLITEGSGILFPFY